MVRACSLLLPLVFCAVAQSYPGGGWLVAEHRPIVGSIDLMLDGCVLDDGLTGFIGGDDVVFMTWDGGRHWHSSVVPGISNDQDILGFYFVSPDSGWAACDYGYVYRTVDGGRSWDIQRPTNTNMFEVFFVDRLRGWIAGDAQSGRNHLMSTIDGGETWQDAAFGSNATVITAIFFIDHETGWVGGKRGDNLPCIYRTDDGGVTWSPQTLPGLPYDTSIESVEFFDEMHGWAATNNRASPGYLLETTDGGLTWTIRMRLPEQYTRLDPLDPDRLTAISYGWSGPGWLSTSVDGGSTWSTSSTPLTGFVPALARMDGAIAVGGGSIIVTRDEGSTWSGIWGTETEYSSLAWAGGSPAFAVDPDGCCDVSPDGSEWHFLPSAPGGSQVRFADGLHGWMLCGDPDEQGVIVWRTVDGGTTWSPADPGAEQDVLGMAFADAWTGWLHGAGGLLMKSTDSGATWTRQPSETDSDILDAFFTDASTGWIAGGSGAGAFISHTTDGTTWTRQVPPPSPLMNPVVSLWFTDPAHGWALSASGLVSRTPDGGQTWDHVAQLPCASGRDILMVDAASGWALSADGSMIYRTDDAGSTWALDWARTSTGLLNELAARDDGTVWACGTEATILRFVTDVSIGEEAAPVAPDFSTSVFPCPATSGSAVLSLCCPRDCTAGIGIYDASGRLVREICGVDLGQGANDVQLWLEGLCSGVYFARVEAGADSAVERLLVLR